VIGFDRSAFAAAPDVSGFGKIKMWIGL